MKVLIGLVLITCLFGLITTKVAVQATMEVRQTSIVGDAGLDESISQCRTIKYFSLKKISSISPSLMTLNKADLIDAAVLVKKKRDWFLIQDSRDFSGEEIKQQLAKVRVGIADAYIVHC